MMLGHVHAWEYGFGLFLTALDEAGKMYSSKKD